MAVFTFALITIYDAASGERVEWDVAAFAAVGVFIVGTVTDLFARWRRAR